MSAGLKLAIFDVDGTLVDSQGHILGGMAEAFAAVERPMPAREDILQLVGLSLDVFFERLCPDLGSAGRDRMVAAYKGSFAKIRVAQGKAASPLYPGIQGVLDRLARIEPLLLGVATGKSRRGLDNLLAHHGLGKRFVTRQVADDHPSKPHPSMLMTALAETGCDPADAVMIGDTEFDLQMAAAAGIPAIGVSWGYHPADHLHRQRPVAVVDDADALTRTILETLGLETSGVNDE